MSKKLLFAIDGIPFSEYGIHVESCAGLFALLKRKSIITNDDAQSHGKFYDMATPAKYNEKEINLSCFINAKSRIEFFSKLNEITKIFDTPGYHRLTASFGGELEVPFEVIRVDGVGVDPTWENTKTVARFKLQFVEPKPVKRIIIANGGELSMSFHSEKLVTISWGDGSYTYDLHGDINVGTDKPSGSQIVIIGDIEEITNFNIDGGSIQWDIWC